MANGQPLRYPFSVPPDCYRQAAAVMLFAGSSATDSPILIVHKPRKRDAWQLPQGGAEEGESVVECALRELKEEAGISGVTVLGESEKCYQYDFPTSYRRFRPDNICGQCVRFVFASVDPDAVVTVDGKEINDFRWIAPEELPKYLKRKEYLKLIQTLVSQGRKLLG